MLVYLRHGATALNGDGKEERLRGWLPVPLSAKGKAQAQAAAKKLPTKAKPDSFETSDLHRAVQTAHIVGKHLGMVATPNTDIRDWNTGDLAGQKVEDVLPQLQHLIAHPNEPAPNGEPFQHYLNRFVPAMRAKITSPKVHVVIGHARGASVLEGLASPVGGVGKQIDPAFVQGKPSVKPGGMLVMDKHYNAAIHQPDESEPDTHDIYQSADHGPFRCDHCEYFTAPTTCAHPEIIKLREGKVEAGACCDYFERDEWVKKSAVVTVHKKAVS